MKLWIILVLVPFIGCLNKETKVLSICDNAFSITIPVDIKEIDRKRIVFGDDLLCSKDFSNQDSTAMVHVELYEDASNRLLTSSLNNQLDALQHLHPGLVVLKNQMIKQHGIEMLSIIYELPIMHLSYGSIVERRVFITPKGRAVVDATFIFQKTKEKEAAIKHVEVISNSIKSVSNFSRTVTWPSVGPPANFVGRLQIMDLPMCWRITN